MEMTPYQRSYWHKLTGNSPATKFARKLQGLCESAGFTKPLKLPREYSCCSTCYVGIGGNAEDLICKVRALKRYSKIRSEYDNAEFDPEYPGVHFEWFIPSPEEDEYSQKALNSGLYEVHVALVVLTSTPENRTSCGIHFAAN